MRERKREKANRKGERERESSDELLSEPSLCLLTASLSMVEREDLAQSIELVRALGASQLHSKLRSRGKVCECIVSAVFLPLPQVLSPVPGNFSSPFYLLLVSFSLSSSSSSCVSFCAGADNLHASCKMTWSLSASLFLTFFHVSQSTLIQQRQV